MLNAKAGRLEKHLKRCWPQLTSISIPGEPKQKKRFSTSSNLPVPLLLTYLRECTSSRDLSRGKRLHQEAILTGADRNIKVASSLINLYAKCGSLASARNVFKTLEQPDVISWNTLLVAHTENGEPEVALEIFSRMQTQGCQPDTLTYLAAIKTCMTLASLEPGVLLDGRVVKEKSLRIGREIHLQASCQGIQSSSIKFSNTLVDFYARCGSLDEAQRVFNLMPCHSMVSWTVLIFGYVENGGEEEAMKLFECMPQEQDGAAFLAVLKALTALCEREEGSRVGKRVVKLRCLERAWGIHSRPEFSACCPDTILMNTLVDVYSKCRCMLDARVVFDRMLRHDVVAWTALMLGYIENGEPEVALDLFSSMPNSGCCPNSLTLVAALKACASVAEAEPVIGNFPVKRESLKRGTFLHLQASRLGLDSDLLVINTLVSMYSSCGSMSDARRVFGKVSHPDPVMWTALMLGYAENSLGEQALEIFMHMKLLGVPQPARTLAAAFKACGSLAALDLCRSLHGEACRLFKVESDPVLATSMMDCYSKCGRMHVAQLVFDSSGTDEVSFTALMSGYGRQGDTEAVFDLFQQMRSEEVELSSVTFLCLLTTCSHAGLVHKGKRFLEMMSPRFGVEAGVEHYVCVIDSLGRANEIGEALRIVEGMPEEFRRRPMVWMVLLGACNKWKNVEVGQLAFQELQELGEQDPSVFELMSGTYKS